MSIVIIYILTYLIILLILFFDYNKIYIDSSNLLSKRISKNVIVTSIYYDDRIKSIRLILINTEKTFPNLSCQLKYNEILVNCKFYYKSYMIHKRPHGHLIIPINEYKYPYKLYINNIGISIPKPHKESCKYKLSVCICKTVNYSAVNRVIQTIETYRYYGVDHFTIYKTSVSNDVEKVFQYYQKLGVIEVITWNITLEYYFIYDYFGQIYKNDDCLYRNMYKSKSLIFTDWDEIIVPVKENNILDMINKNYYRKYNWYQFTSFLFHTELYGKKDRCDINILDTDIYIYREYCIFKDGYVVKNLYTYLPAIYEVETHSVGSSSSTLKKINVKIGDGYIRHTRRLTSVCESFCLSKWMIYPTDKREERIKARVDKIKEILNINIVFNTTPILLHNS